MANPLFRDRFVARFEAAAREARDAIRLNHPGLEGTARELLVGQLLQPLLPSPVQIGTGKLTDSWGRLTGEVDVVVYASDAIAPLMFGSSFGTFPIEAGYYAIEVKSTLDATKLKRTIDGARLAKTLLPKAATPNPAASKLRTALFAWNSDLKPDGESELRRYLKYDSGAWESPALNALCVPGRGYWYFDGGVWLSVLAASGHEEVLNFFAAIGNTIQAHRDPDAGRIGHYLIDVDSVDVGLVYLDSAGEPVFSAEKGADARLAHLKLRAHEDPASVTSELADLGAAIKKIAEANKR